MNINMTETKPSSVEAKIPESGASNLTADKVTEISLAAFLNCAYQRLFLIEGERYRVQVELDTAPPPVEGLDSNIGEASKRLYLSAIIGSIEEEKRAINFAIKNAVSHGK